MKLHEIIPSEGIVLELEGTDRDAVLQELIDALESAGKVTAENRDDLLLHLLKR